MFWDGVGWGVDVLVAGSVYVRELEPPLDVVVECVEELVQLFDGLLDFTHAAQHGYSSFPQCLQHVKLG